jgi:GT2 family glycosyltransferase
VATLWIEFNGARKDKNMTTSPYRPGIPEEILALSHERDLLRRRGQYERADVLKQQIEAAGYVVKDNPHGAHLVILPSIEVDDQHYRTAGVLPSLLDENDTCMFSINILARNTYEQTRRCIESILRFAGDTSLEIVLVDNASEDGLALWTDAFKYREPRLHVLRASRLMGVAEARNVGMKQSRGHYILLLDTCIELTGNIFTPLAETLAKNTLGVTGLHGLHTTDLRHFEESQQTEVEVIDGQCMAFRRQLLKEAGLFDERYRYAHYMDVDFNFALRDQGAQAVVTPDLPVICHPAAQDSRMSEAERTRLAKRNFYRFLDKWGDRDDLLPEAIGD